MILFKFPKKKIVLDCFTTEPHVIEYSPIVPASKLIPQWWKDLPKSYVTQNGFAKAGTMKGCVGMTDYYLHSIAMPMWSDLVIDIEGNNQSYRWQFADGISTASVHETQKEATGFLSSYGHLKLNPPWVFKTKEDINWVWSNPTYNYSETYDIVSLPAIDNYFKQHATTINMMLPLDQRKTITINHGQPIALITPMSDRKVQIVRHLISPQEMENIKKKSTRITFFGSHKQTIKKRQQFSGCPFKQEN